MAAEWADEDDVPDVITPSLWSVAGTLAMLVLALHWPASLPFDPSLLPIGP